MYFHNRAVQGHRLKFDRNDLLLLQARKHSLKHARFAPAIHARVDRVPVSQASGQSAPFTALLGDMQNGVDDFQIAQAHIAAWPRQGSLRFGDLGLR